MLILIQNTIGAIRGLLGIITNGLKMFLPFSSSQQLGEELVTNGDYLNGLTGWSTQIPSGQVVEVVNNQLHIKYDASETRGSTGVNQNILVSGKTYITIIDVESVTGTFKVQVGNQDNTINTSGIKTFRNTSSDPTLFIVRIQNGTSFEATINSITVKEVGQFSLDETINNNNAKLFTGNALDFSGNDYVDIDGFTMSGTTATFAFWANIDSTTNYILDATPNRLVIGFRNNNLSIFSSASSNWAEFGAISTNDYKRVVITTSGTTAKCFINGVQLGVDQTITAIDLSSASAVKIGSSITGNSFYYNGKLSDFQIWNTAWSATDVANDYANPNEIVSSVPKANLIANWALSEGSGAVAFDSVGLGGELVVDGNFPNGDNWTEENGWTFANGFASFLYIDVSNSKLTQDVGLTSGKTYRLTLDYTRSAGSFTVRELSGSGYVVLGTFSDVSDSIELNFNSTSNNGTLYITAVSTTFEGSISNVSVREQTDGSGSVYDGTVIGATYVEAQSSIPQLAMKNWSKGSNMFPYSIDFANSDWTKNSTNATTTITSNFAISPIGNLDASRYVGTGESGLGDKFTLTAVSHTLSFYVKSNTGQNQFCVLLGESNQGSGNIQVTTDWTRISHTFTASGEANKTNGIFRDLSNNDIDILIWGAQLEIGTSAGNYIGTSGLEVTNGILVENANNVGFDMFGNTLRQRLNSLNLTGTGYGEIADSASINPTSEITIQCWIKSNTEDGKGIVAKWTQTGLKDYMLYKRTNSFNFYIGANLLTSGTIPTTGWVNIAGTYDGSNMKTYLNGALSTTTARTGLIPNNTNVLEIGRFSGNSSFSYSERIDDVKIYNRALTADEILQNYNAGESAHTN